MKNERIQKIKRRWQAEMDAFQNHDIAYLLSEVERLQEENKVMKDKLDRIEYEIDNSDMGTAVDNIIEIVKG
ncbi:hypothetical protein D3C76_222100 [compost metagenome]